MLRGVENTAFSSLSGVAGFLNNKPGKEKYAGVDCNRNQIHKQGR